MEEFATCSTEFIIVTMTAAMGTDSVIKIHSFTFSKRQNPKKGFAYINPYNNVQFCQVMQK